MNSSFSTLIPLAAKGTEGHREYDVAIIFIVLSVITSILVSMRLIYKGMTRFGPEDFAIIPGFVMYIVWGCIVIHSNFRGTVGAEIKDMTWKQIQITYRTSLLSIWIYPAMATSIRVSILLFYRLLFSTTMPAIGAAIWVLLVLQAVFCVLLTVLPAITPAPLYLLWDPHRILGNYEFYDWYTRVQLATYIISLVFDIILLILPIYPTVSLRLPIVKRATTALIFVMGAAACFAAAWKLQVFVMSLDVTRDTPPAYLADLYIPPQFKKGESLWYSAYLEPSLGLGGSSLPAIRNLICMIKSRTTRSRDQRQMHTSRHRHGYWLYSLDRGRSSECGLTGHYSGPSDHSGQSHSDQSHSGHSHGGDIQHSHSAV